MPIYVHRGVGWGGGDPHDLKNRDPLPKLCIKSAPPKHWDYY